MSRDGAAAILAGMRGGVLVIGFDDALDEIVADDIALIEIDERDAFNFADDFDGFDEAGAAGFGQVDLGHVAGDDGFGIEAETREEHFHLFAGGVLGFVEDDEGIVERAAAHEGERGDFDDAFFEEIFELVGFEEVVERVVKRAHVGIHFFLERAGKEAEAFAGFDGGARENDAIYLLR